MDMDITQQYSIIFVDTSKDFTKLLHHSICWEDNGMILLSLEISLCNMIILYIVISNCISGIF